VIDWLSVLANLPWIVGLALIVSALSYRRYAAALPDGPHRPDHRSGRRSDTQATGGSTALPVDGGMLLILLGVALTAAETWRKALSVGIFVAYIAMLAVPRLQDRRHPSTGVDQRPHGDAGAGELSP